MNRDTWLKTRGKHGPVLPEPIIMGGGLDVMTPPFLMKPGLLRAAQNFECSLYGGYRRIAGYERFDGQSKPSDAAYAIITASSITGGAVGNTLTGATSAGTGKIIALPGGSFVITQVTGTFVSGENLNVGAGTIAVATSAAIVDGASTPLLHAQYKNLAADVYRALIAAVPGFGNVLGVWMYNDVVYAFRATAADHAKAALYKSTAGGWSLVALGREVAFTSGGVYTMVEGDTITGATSGATAVLARVALRSGTYAGGDAAGYLFFASQTGVFQAENLNVGANLNVATIASNAAAITLLSGGRYEFVNANFTGSTNTKRMYGCDGINNAFEFDGTTYVKIYTGMTVDAPSHIDFHLYHLFLSFFGSLQYSSTGFPYQWTPVTGAAELAMGDTITGLQVQPAGTTSAALAVFTRGRVSILYGTGSSSFQLLPYRDEIGAIPYTMQTLAQTVFLDSQGVTDLATVNAFGNFSHAVLTNQIKSLLTGWRNVAIASSLSRDLSQYRLFFTNGYALYAAMIGRKVIGITQILFPNVVRCACQGIMSDNTEVSYFGDSTGMVYQMDKGTSFDGSDIEAYIYLAYNFFGSQRLLKRYRSGVLEVAGSGYAAFSFGYLLGYGGTDVIQPSAQALTTSFDAAFWESGNWDAGVWDGVTLAPASFDLDGEAENISIAITSTGDYFQPFSITGGVLHMSPRREMR